MRETEWMKNEEKEKTKELVSSSEQLLFLQKIQIQFTAHTWYHKAFSMFSTRLETRNEC